VIAVADGIRKTWQVLARTQNRATLDVLRAGLRSSSGEVRAEAIRCAVRRNNQDFHRQLIGHFSKMAAAERAILCEAHSAMPRHMAAALKHAVLEGKVTLCESACQIVEQSRDFDLFPILVQAAERGASEAAAFAKGAMSRLASILHGKLAEGAVSGEPHGRDPSFIRRNVLVALERSLNDFGRHHCRAIVEAFLLLAPSDDETLLRILQDPQHSCHTALTDALSSSSSAGAIERLSQLARDTSAPPAALIAMANRTDRQFVEHLLHSMKRPLPLRVLHNMKRLRRVAWLEEYREMLVDFDAAAQAVAVELAMASGISDDSKFALLSLMMQDGLAEARRLSCSALTQFNCPTATVLILAALDDPDPAVRASVLLQLRPRGIPDALRLLAESLNSPVLEICEAARSALAEFNFVRYRSMFHLLDASAARTTGELVYKVDRTARQGLIEELSSPSVSAKLRGIEMVLAMGAAGDLCDKLISLANHENLTVRREAVDALGQCPNVEVENVLQLAMDDPHESIRDTAKEALARIQASFSGAAPKHAILET
jgi:hypothetical protein